MNVSQIVAKIKRLGLETPEDFREAGIRLKREGSGLFRVGYRIVGFPLIAKFPQMGTPARSGKSHSAKEVKKIQRLRKIRSMRAYLPTVYYYNRESGVLVTSWHDKFADFEDAFVALGRLTTRALANWTGVTVSDIHDDNVRKGRSRRQAILIDLGF